MLAKTKTVKKEFRQKVFRMLTAKVFVITGGPIYRMILALVYGFVLIMTVSGTCAWAQTSLPVPRAKLRVNGFTCTMCGLSVEKSLQTLHFIQRIESDYQEASFYLYFKDQAEVSPARIAEKVRASGFYPSQLIFYLPAGMQESSTVRLSGWTYEWCFTPNASGTDSVQVIGRHLLPPQEYKRKLAQHRSCLTQDYPYWLLSF
ncbi:MAG: heavy-metal-associated domain-containing protein [Cytophagaceae bacterium]|jgi:copper chaperone CopZ|nr:heavy-metal-associated domain-containing protein [Cytophagaceae bacterium]